MIYSFLRVAFSCFFRVLFRAEIKGQEHLPREGAVILAANHMSNWDPPLVASFLSRPVSYMAKAELFRIPVFGRVITACHSFPVHRGAADRGAIKAAVKVLKEGRCLGLFPEGTRSRDGHIHKAEAGVGLIAAMTGAPVVPAAVIGTNQIFSFGHFLPKLRVTYGEPMRFQGDPRNKEDLAAFSQSVMDRIAAMKGTIIHENGCV